MSVSTITWSPTAQFGFSIGAFWGDRVIGPGPPGSFIPLSPDFLALGGMIFDAKTSQTLRFATVGGLQRPLDPPILLSPFRLDLLMRSSLLDSGSDNRLEIGLVPTGAPADYANGAENVPWGRGEQVLETFILDGMPPNFATPILFSLTLSDASITWIRVLVTSRANWTGRVAFSLRAVGANAFDIHNFTPNGLISAVTTQESVFFSGLAGGATGPRVRAVRDHRFGLPAWNTQLVRDGDNPGLFVRPDDFDPEDPEQSYRPRPGEGTVDDEIGNL